MLLAPERTDSATRHELESRLPAAIAPGEDLEPTRYAIRRYLLENFLFSEDPSAIADDDSLLKLGIIDSVGALEIALFLEENFGIVVAPVEMLPQNLDSVDNLVAFVASKQTGI